MCSSERARALRYGLPCLAWGRKGPAAGLHRRPFGKWFLLGNNNMSIRVNRIVALAAVLVLPISAWAADATLALTLKNHKFTPAEPVIPANTKVKVTIKNTDATAAEFESDDFKAEKVIPPGKEATI